MKYLKILLLKYIKPQTRFDGNCTTHFKVLFGKIYITEQRVEDRELHLNQRLLKEYMAKTLIVILIAFTLGSCASARYGTAGQRTKFQGDMYCRHF